MLVKLSLVVPCYNEEETLVWTCNKLIEKLSHIKNKLITDDSEIIFVDDGSKDNTWKIISELAEKHPEVRGVKLMFNAGHQNALMAGIRSAKGEAIISLDADLQDDINAIDEMILKYNEGCEVVYGVRVDRSTDTAFKKWTAQLYYNFLEKIGIPIIYNHADYRLISKKVTEILSQYNEKEPFFRALIPSLKLKSGEVGYKRNSRQFGESKYPLFKMIKFAVNGLISFSTSPLIFLIFLGLFFIIETSISPKIVIIIVLGIGVADITNISQFLPPLSDSLFLCFTPNLCCSSIIINPNFL